MTAKYKLPLRNMLIIIGTLFALYGLYWSITTVRAGYLLYVEADKRVARAKFCRENIQW